MSQRWTRLPVAARLDEFEQAIAPAEQFVHALAASLPLPVFEDGGGTHAGYRFAAPDHRHFCLLKLVRALSSLNAMICLARRGYAQEIGVLIRVFVECTEQIDFILFARASANHLKDARQLIADYFSDRERNVDADHQKSKVTQARVREHVSKLQSSLFPADESRGDPPTRDLLNRIARAFSAYVHCKYPETMDLYGGLSPRFHLRGMSGTPKDVENVELVEQFVESVRLSVLKMILWLGLEQVVREDAVLLEWYNAQPECSARQAQ